ncbi:Uncharacterised protein [Klebsiella pneumoniae]|uniref:Uncharacterized protein n=1 Tax=Klebsiella pneumoniae TaxID=573 RepID=A0A486V221_KLEPN|nr:Uncharacterised protein [Klebsiella pneumoniae]CAA0327311.1 Uncharacterised protein [Klebsiella pneumoniae]SWP93904.1 Uncharacterised protein [Klebsiella pneumoniae]SWY20258.1 Uncharacterised protein [Klebsiella pneumoniae]SWY34462.1 Uncharacterised protein [Klebsiella pneumoniae]
MQPQTAVKTLNCHVLDNSVAAVEQRFRGIGITKFNTCS